MAMRKKGQGGFGVVRVQTERERDQYVAALVSQWESEAKRKAPQKGDLPFVTISRQFGCKAMEFGLRLADRLNQRKGTDGNWAVFDQEIVRRIAQDLRMSRALTDLLAEGSQARITSYMTSFFYQRPTRDEIFRNTVRVVRSLCEKGNTIVIGRGGCSIAADLPKGFHLRLTAPLEWRVKQVMATYDVSEKDALERIRLMDKERKSYFRTHFQADLDDPAFFDLVLNQARFPMDGLLDVTVKAMEARGLLPSG